VDAPVLGIAVCASPLLAIGAGIGAFSSLEIAGSEVTGTEIFSENALWVL
jgi:hypothetical protein